MGNVLGNSQTGGKLGKSQTGDKVGKSQTRNKVGKAAGARAGAATNKNNQTAQNTGREGRGPIVNGIRTGPFVGGKRFNFGSGQGNQAVGGKMGGQLAQKGVNTGGRNVGGAIGKSTPKQTTTGGKMGKGGAGGMVNKASTPRIQAAPRTTPTANKAPTSNRTSSAPRMNVQRGGSIAGGRMGQAGHAARQGNRRR
jgi:hypothetical protein